MRRKKDGESQLNYTGSVVLDMVLKFMGGIHCDRSITSVFICVRKDVRVLSLVELQCRISITLFGI